MNVPHPRFVVVLVTLLAIVSPSATGDTGMDPIGPQEPDAQEQLGIYELNLARHDPPAYGRRIGVDLDSVEPRAPLAVSRELTGSSRYHALEMLAYRYFDHVSPVTGKAANQMAVDHGYDLFGSGLGYPWGDSNYIESIAYGMNALPDFPAAIEGLIRDHGVPSLGHRLHLLAVNPGFVNHREVGLGRAAELFTRYYAVHTGYLRASDLFLTGVVFEDRNGNGRYDLSEGIGGATVSAAAAGSTESMAQGGWSLRVPAGRHRVTCSGGSFAGEAFADADVVNGNVEVDFRSGHTRGLVDFAPAPDFPVSIEAAPPTGTAPLEVLFTARSSAEDAGYTWTFPGGETADGPLATRVFEAAGLFPVTVRAESPTLGREHALALVAVGGEAGAGEGTTPPADRSLRIRKQVAKANLALPGADRLRLQATITMPEGFRPGPHPVAVSVAGVTMTFVLDAKNRAVDELGNRIALRYRRPKDGGPLGPNILARLDVTLRGDFRDAFLAVGLDALPVKATPVATPAGFLMRELVYR